MSYTPINSYVYEAAYAGALAGMNASAYTLATNATTYAMNAAIAGAWAQEFDTLWNSAATLNQLQFDAIKSLSETNWYDRTPQAVVYTNWASTGNVSALDPSTYQQSVTALISIMSAASLYFTGQGITPPAMGNGNAISIGGIPVTGISASRSYIMAGNGTQIYSRPDRQLNPLDFGAKGDNVTDDLAAFNAMFAAKEASGAPCLIVIPPKTFYLSATPTVGTVPFTMEGSYVYCHNLIFFGNSAVWNDGVTVTGSILRFGSDKGIQISALYQSIGTCIRDLGLIGPGTDGSVGFYNAAPGGITHILIENVLFGNWDTAIFLGGAEETSIRYPRILGCRQGMPFRGTPQKTGGLTNCTVYDFDIQACTTGIELGNPTGLHFIGYNLCQTCGAEANIVSVSNTTPVQIQLSAADVKKLYTGCRTTISGVGAGINGRWTLTVVDATHISLDGSTASGAFGAVGKVNSGAAVLFYPTIEMLTASQTGTDPLITWSGTPVAQNTSIEIDITSSGVLGVSTFQWLLNGVVQAVGVATAASVVLGTTGVTVNFPVGSYTNGNVYTGVSYGGSINEVTFSHGWMENNQSYGFEFDLTNQGVGVTDLTIMGYHFGGGATGDLGQNGIHFETMGTNASIAKLLLMSVKAPSTDLVQPASGVYAVSLNNQFKTLTINYPQGWTTLDYGAYQNQFPSLLLNDYLKAVYIQPNTSNPVASTGFIRLQGGNTNQIVFRNNANTQDVVAFSTDTSNDLIFGEVTNSTGCFFKGKNTVAMGVSAAANALLISGIAGNEQHFFPILGGDGTAGVTGSPHAVSGTISTNLGDSDQSFTALQYSRRAIKCIDTFTAKRKRTLPTPNNADGYYEKTVINATAGGFGIDVSCGGGTVVTIANGKTAIVGCYSTGDCVRVTADV